MIYKQERERVKSRLGFTPLEITNSCGIKGIKERKWRINKSLMGFTLIELLIVIAIIGLLSSVVLASLNSARGKARDAATKAVARQIFNAVEMFYDKKGFYPDTAGATNYNYGYNPYNNLEGALQTEVPEVLSKIPLPQSKGGYTWYMYYKNSEERFCIYSWLENPLSSTDPSYVKYDPPVCDFPNNQCGICGCAIRYKICN